MSTRLRDLIKAVRSCKTAAEERAAISKECAAIRTAFKDEDSENRHRNVAKLLYIHMLGYPTHFGQMECLKLIVSPFYADKRIGYLGLMLLLDERQEVLMLVTNSLKNDLSHPNQFIAGLALCSLGNIASPGIARDCAPEIEKLLASTNPYIRKKAALCAIRIVRKVPELLENFVARSKSLLNERNHGVILTGITLIIELCEMDGTNVDYFRKQQTVPALVRLLKNLVLSGYAPEHDVSGITDPFVQVKLLRLLRILGKGDPEASDAMNDILAQVATNTESTKNVGNSILYECVLTIMSIESESGLKVMAINILGRFLLNRDNNIRYVALNTLSKVVNTDIQAVQRHRNTIVDCLKDPDVSIRRRALDLIYSLVNESNIRILVRELLNFLLISDVQFRPELVAKLCMVTEKYAPTKRWHIDTILRVMSIGGNFIPDDVPNNIVTLISSSPELHSYAVQKLYLALTQDPKHQSLVQVGVWCVGEFGDLLIAQDKPNDAKGDEESISITVSEADTLVIIEQILRDPVSTVVTRQYALTALLKLSNRFSPSSITRIQSTIANFRNNINVELQQRSCEYLQMFHWEQIRSQVLERMPAFEGRNTESGSSPTPSAPAPAQTVRPVGQPGSAIDPLDLLLDVTPQQQNQGTAAGRPQQQQPQQPAHVDILQDLFGPSPVVQTNSVKPTTTAPPPVSDSLLDLLGGPLPTSTPTPTTNFYPPQGVYPGGAGTGLNIMGSPPIMGAPPTLVGSPNAGTRPAPAIVSNNNPLGDLMMGGISAAPAGGVTITGYAKNGINVSFEASKNPQQPQLVNINAFYSNSNPFPVNGFTLQAAVPKYLKIQMSTPSGNVLPPSNSGRVTQPIKVMNSMPGQKPVMLRIKLDYIANGSPVSDTVDVSFPPSV